MPYNKPVKFAPVGAGQPKRGFAAGCRLLKRYT